MDLLDVDDVHTDDAHDAHASLLDDQSALDASESLRDDGVALPDDDVDDVDTSSLRPLTLRGNKRRKIGKALQLILLRKYVNHAKQIHRIPDRATTEQLLEEGYDEFYFQGGNLNEPRLGYSAFLKLIRNRRCEVTRQARDLQTLSHSRGSRRNQKEQVEIRALIDELDQVRQNTIRGSPLDYATFDSNDLTPAVHTPTVLMDSAGSTVNATVAQLHPTTTGNSDEILISREKLDMMLRFAQETLNAQKKILAEVRAIEQHLDMS